MFVLKSFPCDFSELEFEIPKWPVATLEYPEIKFLARIWFCFGKKMPQKIDS